jgi:hypothetical protein
MATSAVIAYLVFLDSILKIKLQSYVNKIC